MIPETEPDDTNSIIKPTLKLISLELVLNFWTCQNEINPTITTALRTIISPILHDMRKLKYEKKSNLWIHTDFWGVMQHTAASLFLNDM